MGNPLLIALLVLILAPLVWFGAHYVVGRLVRPALLFEESARIAELPIVAVIGVALLAQWLQPVVWSLLRSAGVL